MYVECMNMYYSLTNSFIASRDFSSKFLVIFSLSCLSFSLYSNLEDWTVNLVVYIYNLYRALYMYVCTYML